MGGNNSVRFISGDCQSKRIPNYEFELETDTAESVVLRIESEELISIEANREFILIST